MPPEKRNDFAERGVAEDVIALGAGGDAQPVADVVASVSSRESGASRQRTPMRWRSWRSSGDSSIASSSGCPSSRIWISLVALGLEIREQADLLERLGQQALRFVDDQQHALAGRVLLEQEVVQRVDQLARPIGPRLARRPSSTQDRLEQLARATASD